jgi:excisionase family DNA binding protein
MSQLRTRFGAEVRAARRAARMTQEELAETSRTSVDYLSKIERGLNSLGQKSWWNFSGLCDSIGTSFFGLTPTIAYYPLVALSWRRSGLMRPGSLMTTRSHPGALGAEAHGARDQSSGPQPARYLRWLIPLERLMSRSGCCVRIKILLVRKPISERLSGSSSASPPAIGSQENALQMALERPLKPSRPASRPTVSIDPQALLASPLLSVVEVANLLGVSQDIVRARIRNKQLRAGKIGGQWRVRHEDLAEYMMTIFAKD